MWIFEIASAIYDYGKQFNQTSRRMPLSRIPPLDWTANALPLQ